MGWIIWASPGHQQGIRSVFPASFYTNLPRGMIVSVFYEEMRLKKWVFDSGCLTIFVDKWLGIDPELEFSREMIIILRK